MEEWSDEMIVLMLDQLNERRLFEHDAMKPEKDRKNGTKDVQLGAKYLNDPAFLAAHARKAN